jgi:rubredoxin
MDENERMEMHTKQAEERGCRECGFVKDFYYEAGIQRMSQEHADGIIHFDMYMAKIQCGNCDAVYDELFEVIEVKGEDDEPDSESE